MGGRMWKWDTYDIRKYTAWGIGAVLDIGANVGGFSLMSRILFPIARIHAIEPCQETYQYLADHVGPWSVRCHHMALGNGEELHFQGVAKSGFNKFHTTKEFEQHKLKPTYTVPSRRLSTMFADLKVDEPAAPNKARPYIIKMDCEGGERFILDDPGAVPCIRNSTAFLLELHFKMAGRREVWTDYLKQFEDTHEVLTMRWFRDEIRRYYVYEPMDKIPDGSRHQIQLLRKDWREMEQKVWWV